MSETAAIQPLGDRLKVLPLVPKGQTKGGIIMPEMSEARERPMEGIVLAVGRGRALDTGKVVKLECEAGDIVQFGKFAGIHVFDEAVGFDVLLMREDEALGRKLAAMLTLVPVGAHAPDYVGMHVPGDPRCSICRAGGAGETQTATR